MSDDDTRTTRKGHEAPDPDDPRKPASPTDLTQRSWLYVLRTTVRQFVADQCTDQAAALTYYAVLSLFPAAIAVISLLGLVGDPSTTTQAVLDIVDDVAPGGAADALAGPVTDLASAPAAGLGLVLGLAGALWSASGYVGAFGRAMNRVYEVTEGRPIWKLRPLVLAVTLVLVLVTAVVALGITLSGPVARSVGATVGLGDEAVTAWGIVRWPLMLVVIIVLVAVLYYATPNVRQPRFRWVSVGAVVAIVGAALASLGFGIYVSNFGQYDATYGALAGAIVALLWLWIINLALLFGAELDAEVERGRELQAGIAAEESLQLPPRDTRQADKNARARAEDVRRGRALREHSAATARPAGPAARTGTGSTGTGTGTGSTGTGTGTGSTGTGGTTEGR